MGGRAGIVVLGSAVLGGMIAGRGRWIVGLRARSVLYGVFLVIVGG